MTPLKSLTFVLVALPLAACGTAGSGSSSQNQNSLMDAFMALHAESRSEAEPQQAAFEERVVIGMTADEVIQAAASVAREFGHYGSRAHSVRAEGNVEVSTSGVTCFTDGEPARRQAEASGDAEVEVWEYRCFNRVYTLTFTARRLSEIDQRSTSARAPGDQQ